MLASNTSDALAKVLKDFKADSKPHDLYVRKVDGWYKAYRGEPDQKKDSTQWQTQLYPKYAFQVVETLAANVVDPHPGWRVRPAARMASQAELQMLTQGAKANEILLNAQAEQDGFALKQSFFAKQGLIAGLTVRKTQWAFAERDQKQQAIVPIVIDDLGTVVHSLGVTDGKRVVRDDPTVEVVDVRDFIPHEGATTLENCQRVTHRVWQSFDDLKRLEKLGAYGPQAGGDPVDGLKDSKDFTAGASERETTLFQADRTKDKIEVLEQWRREPDGSIRVISVANRSVVLRDTPSPFWHGEYPFVVCTPIPDLGRIYGISVVELIEDNQEALWDIGNQRLDNVKFLNNAMALARDDYENLEDFEVAPGAVNMVSDPGQVTMWSPNPMAAEISLSAENILKQDIQNIPGASPTLLGQTDPSAQTATEISLSTSLAQRRVSQMKQQFKWADNQTAQHWMSLNQQFVNEPRLVQKIGADGAAAWEAIEPLLLQGDYSIVLESMDESLLRQERVAEASSSLQIAASVIPVWAQVAMNPSSGLPMLNLKSFMDDLLEAKGVLDKERYYSAAPPPPQPPQGQPGQPPQGPQPGPPQGVSAPQATDMNSPSNAFTQSPVGAMQRLGAMAGGPSNVPNG